MELNSGKGEVFKKERRSITERLFNLTIFKSKANELHSDQSEEVKQILESINNTRKEWARANMNFEYADCQESIDYYTYTIKANEVMYEYLIKKAKEKGIRVDFSESMDFYSFKSMV